MSASIIYICYIESGNTLKCPEIEVQNGASPTEIYPVTRNELVAC